MRVLAIFAAVLLLASGDTAEARTRVRAPTEVTCKTEGETVDVLGNGAAPEEKDLVIVAPDQDISCNFVVRPPTGGFAQLLVTKYDVTNDGARLQVQDGNQPPRTALSLARHTSKGSFPLLATKSRPLTLVWSVNGAVEGEKWRVGVKAAVAPCDDATCSGHGTCTASGCVCKAPFVGTDCKSSSNNDFKALKDTKLASFPGMTGVSASSVAKFYKNGLTLTWNPENDGPSPNQDFSLRDAIYRVTAAAVTWQEARQADPSVSGDPVFKVVYGGSTAKPILAYDEDAAACDVRVDLPALSNTQALQAARFRPRIVFDGKGLSLNMASRCHFFESSGIDVEVRALTLNGTVGSARGGSAFSATASAGIDLETVTMRRCAAASGGCLAATDDGTVRGVGVDMEAGRAGVNGGCASVESEGRLELTNSTLLRCGLFTGYGKGAAVYGNDTRVLSFTGVQVSDSFRASDKARVIGAVYVHGLTNNFEGTFSRVQFRQNRLAGAAVTIVGNPHATRHKIAFTDAEFSRNTVILAENAIAAGEVVNRTAAGIHLVRVGSKVQVKNATFLDNAGAGYGAFGLLDQDRPVTDKPYSASFHMLQLAVTDSVFRRNSAKGAQVGVSGAVGEGAGLTIWSGDGVIILANIINGEFRDNVAASRGGALSFAAGRRADRKDTRGILTFENCIMEGNNATAGGAVSLKFDKTALTSSNISYVRNHAQTGSGGGVKIAGAAATYLESGTTFANNTARQSGGGMFIGAACDPCRLQDSQSEGNRAQQGSGGLASVASGRLTYRNVTLLHNRASGPGGAIQADSLKSFNFTSCTARGNSAEDEGGVLAVKLGSSFQWTLRLHDNTFEDNVAATKGGADLSIRSALSVALDVKNVTLSNSSTPNRNAVGAMRLEFPVPSPKDPVVKMNNVHCSRATAGVGACMYVINAVLQASQCSFAVSRAEYLGGAIALAGAASLIANDVTVTKCRAGRAGGAIVMASGARLEATGCTLSNNHAGYTGGAIHAGSEVWMDVAPDPTSKEDYVIAFARVFPTAAPETSVVLQGGTEIVENDASRGGALHAQRVHNLRLLDAKILRNRATVNGGGLWYSCRSKCAKSVAFETGTRMDGNSAGLDAEGKRVVGDTKGRGGAIFWAANRASDEPADTSKVVFGDKNKAVIGPVQGGSPYKLVCASNDKVFCRTTEPIYSGVNVGNAVTLRLVDYFGLPIAGVDGLRVNVSLDQSNSDFNLLGTSLNITVDGNVTFTDLMVETSAEAGDVEFEARVLESPLMSTDTDTDSENFDIATHAKAITLQVPFSNATCPIGLALVETSSGSMRCKFCEGPSTYAIMNDTSQCYNCLREGWDDGARCMGGVDIDVRQGYWRGPHSHLLFKCGRDTCLGGLDSECAEGSAGPMCNLCLDNHYPAAEGCIPCNPDKDGYVAVFIILLVVIHAAAAFIVNALRLTIGTVFSGSFRVIVNHVQTLGLIFFSTGFWPKPLYTVLSSLSVSVQLPYALNSYICGFGGMSTPDQVEFSTFLPLYVAGLGGAPFLFTAFRKIVLPRVKDKKSPLHRARKAMAKRKRQKAKERRQKARAEAKARKEAEKNETKNPLAGAATEQSTVNPLAAHTEEKETVNPLAGSIDDGASSGGDYSITTSSGVESDEPSEAPSDDEADASNGAVAAAPAAAPAAPDTPRTAKKKKFKKIKRKELIRIKKLVHAAFVLLMLVFPIMARFSFMAFGCVVVDTSNMQNVVMSDFAVPCDSEGHQRMRVFSIINSVLVVVGLPLFALFTQIVWKTSRWQDILYLLKCGCVQPGYTEEEEVGDDEGGDSGEPGSGMMSPRKGPRRTMGSFRGWQLERDTDKLVDNSSPLRRVVRKAALQNKARIVVDQAFAKDDGPSLMSVGAQLKAAQQPGAKPFPFRLPAGRQNAARPRGPTQEFRNPTFDAPAETGNPLMQQRSVNAPAASAIRAQGPARGASLPRGLGARPMQPALSATTAGVASRPVAAAVPRGVARPGIAARPVAARPGMVAAARPGMAAQMARAQGQASTAVASQGATASVAAPVTGPRGAVLPIMSTAGKATPVAASPMARGPPGTGAPRGPPGTGAPQGPPGTGAPRGPPGTGAPRGPPGTGGGGPSADKPVGGDGLEATVRLDRTSSRITLTRRKPPKKTWYHRFTRSTCLVVEYLEEDYDENYWYWEFVVSIRKIIIAVAVAAVGPSMGSTSGSASMLLVVLFFSLVSHLYAKPYKFGICNLLETVSLSVCLLSAWNGLLSTLEEPIAQPIGYLLVTTNLVFSCVLGFISLFDLYMSGTVKAISSRVFAICCKPKKGFHVETRSNYDGTKYLRYGADDEDSLVVEESKPLMGSDED